MKNLLRFVFFLIVVSFKSNGQSISLPLGAWREHTPFNKGIDVAEDRDGLVYCASQFGLFTYNKSDGELNALSRLRELSDQEITAIEYDKVSGVILVAYENSNIDIIYPDKSVVNLPDIKAKNIVGGKHINSILFINGFGYLACDFGIVVVDINRREIKETYYIAQNGIQLIINCIAYNGTEMIAGTDNGIYRANFSDPNIFNYTGWTKDTAMSQPNGNYTSATAYDGKFYACKTGVAWGDDTTEVYDNNSWTPKFYSYIENGLITSDDNYLYLKNDFRYLAYDHSGNIVKEVLQSSYANADFRMGYVDNGGNFWMADNKNGLVVRYNDGRTGMYFPNGPSSDAAWAISSRSGTLWVGTGVISGDDPIYGERNGVYRFSDNQWQSYDCTNDAIYQRVCPPDGHGSPATNCVAIDPKDVNHAFIGSWGSGLFEYRKEGGVELYKSYNSTLHTLSSDTNVINVGGVDFDSDGNLWVVACGTTKPISIRKPNGSWLDFYIAETALTDFALYNMVVDDYGQKWFCARHGSTGEGLCVFKENSITDSYNTQFKRLTSSTGNGALPDEYVWSIAKDKDGALWIGSSKGVSVIYNPGSVFTGGNYDSQKIIIQQDGYNQYLLETEYVTAIAVDGANRKWFGTNSGGVFLMSADGQKQLLNFNVLNSPLPSNTVKGIAIDDFSGEVFFATEKGIVSYRGDATEGGDACSDYYTFPNPVRSDYHGPIAIRGLVANADVKIANVAGNVVYHTKANGGEAIWNGNNFEGQRAKTGVYIVYITNDDGTQTCTTKLLLGN